MNNGTSEPPRLRITAKQAASYIPPLAEMVGNYRIKEQLCEWLRGEAPEADANTMLIGPPGSGKTVTLISYLRQRLANPSLGYEDDADFFTVIAGKRYGFMRIDGASVDEARLRAQVQGACYNGTVHTFVLLDEAGELLFRGLDEQVRPMLDHPQVTTYGTAQNFHSKKRRADSQREHEERIKAFGRRFPVNMYTDLPEEDEMCSFLKQRLQLWGLEQENDETVRLLVKKARSSDGYIPGYALGCLITAIAQKKTRVTYNFVSEYTSDPLMR